MSDLPAETLEAKELEAAIGQVGQNGLADGLEDVARKLPVAVGVETVAIRVRDSDADGNLHLVAAQGTPVTDRRSLFSDAQSMPQARALFALRNRHSLARALGLTWLEGAWIKDDDEPLGAIAVGSRTERRPTEEQIALLGAVAEQLGPPLRKADRRRATLEALAGRASRASLSVRVEAPDRVAGLLRPRELTVLALYSDGVSAVEIADAFVISPHTVRTHIKNAYRRLGVHSREEAARVIHAERLLELV